MLAYENVSGFRRKNDDLYPVYYCTGIFFNVIQLLAGSFSTFFAFEYHSLNHWIQFRIQGKKKWGPGFTRLYVINHSAVSRWESSGWRVLRMLLTSLLRISQVTHQWVALWCRIVKNLNLKITCTDYIQGWNPVLAKTGSGALYLKRRNIFKSLLNEYCK